VQYSWIKNEEFAGEFYAYDNGYYDQAGFSKVTGVAGPDTGVAKLLSGSVQVALTDAASVGAAVAEQSAAEDHRDDLPEEPVHDPVAEERRQHRDARRPHRQEDRRAGLQRLGVQGAPRRERHRPERADDRAGRLRPDPLINGEVDGFMAYLTNEAITVEMAGYPTTNLAYAENGLPYVAESYAVTDQYLAEHKDLLKAFLTAEIKGWTDTFTSPSTTP
jgi:hypothetical protein